MILVCGEALMDLFPVSDPAATGLFRAVPGGSPYNVAIGAARLGADAAFLGGLSNDGFGAELRQRLGAERVSLAYAVEKTSLTTLSVVHCDASGVATYAFHGEGKADRALTRADMPVALPVDCWALAFGSYTLAVSPVADAFLNLATREAGRRVISLDPNIRPTATPEMSDWNARFDRFLAKADVVKTSEEDLAHAFGSGVPPLDAARVWLGKGPALIFVTLGPRGAIAMLGDGRVVAAPGRSVDVVDTVGAGDTFHAAILAEFERRRILTSDRLKSLSDDTLGEVLAYAVCASSITCSRRGADLPTDAEVRAALN